MNYIFLRKQNNVWMFFLSDFNIISTIAPIWNPVYCDLKLTISILQLIILIYTTQ